MLFLFALLLKDINVSCNGHGKRCCLPLGTFDTARTPLADPSSAAPVRFVARQTEGAEPEDASVVPWQDRST